MTRYQFNTHYEDNIQALRYFARKLTHDPVEAQDLVQETAMKAFKSMKTFKEGTSFKSWAFTILKNTFITKYNKKKRRGVVSAPVEDFAFALESSQLVSNEAESKLRINDIVGCIDELSMKSRIPFLMYVEGYQYQEIAESLDIPMGTVKSRINFARTKLKGMIGNLDTVAA